MPKLFENADTYVGLKFNRLFLAVFTPTPSPPFTDAFENISGLLQCSSLLHFLNDLLLKLSPDAEAPLQWSDKLFEKVIRRLYTSMLRFRFIKMRPMLYVKKSNAFCVVSEFVPCLVFV